MVIFRFDVLEQIEDSLTGLKVIEYDENCFRLSMQTYIPKLEELLSQQISEDVNEPSEVNHELLIELVDGTMELKNVEVSHPLSFLQNITILYIFFLLNAKY